MQNFLFNFNAIVHVIVGVWKQIVSFQPKGYSNLNFVGIGFSFSF